MRAGSCGRGRNVGRSRHHISLVQAADNLRILAVSDARLYHFLRGGSSRHHLYVVFSAPAGNRFIGHQEDIGPLFGCYADGNGQSFPQAKGRRHGRSRLTLLVLSAGALASGLTSCKCCPVPRGNVRRLPDGYSIVGCPLVDCLPVGWPLVLAGRCGRSAA